MLAAISALGLLTILCSGGGSSGGDCSFFTNTCDITSAPPYTAPPSANVYPQRITAQVGETVTFAGNTTADSSAKFQWRRSTDGGHSYVDIAGATAQTYSRAGVNLADDANVFLVEVESSSGVPLVTAVASLAVSSMPGVVLQDSEFALADWAVAAVPEPLEGGPTHTEAQNPTGGNPGAFRQMVHDMTAGPSALKVFHALQSARYDPAVQGAIYVIDFAEDCIAPVALAAGVTVDSTLLLEQGERRYAATRSNACNSSAWVAQAPIASLKVVDFVLQEGPACAAEACPDFSASAAPLQLGFVRGTRVSAGSAAASVAHGIDNWKVTVWRR